MFHLAAVRTRAGRMGALPNFRSEMVIAHGWTTEMGHPEPREGRIRLLPVPSQ